NDRMFTGGHGERSVLRYAVGFAPMNDIVSRRQTHTCGGSEIEAVDAQRVLALDAAQLDVDLVLRGQLEAHGREFGQLERAEVDHAPAVAPLPAEIDAAVRERGDHHAIPAGDDAVDGADRARVVPVHERAAA